MLSAWGGVVAVGDLQCGRLASVRRCRTRPLTSAAARSSLARPRPGCLLASARRLPATCGNADNLDREDFRSGSYVQTFEFLALAGAQRDRFTLRGLRQAGRLATQDDF